MNKLGRSTRQEEKPEIRRGTDREEVRLRFPQQENRNKASQPARSNNGLKMQRPGGTSYRRFVRVSEFQQENESTLEFMLF